MRKFKIQISSRLIFDETDVKKSKEIISELKKLEAEHPKIVAKSEEAKELVWEASEALRKANILGYSGSRLQELKADLYKAQAAVTLPLKEFNDQRDELLGKIGGLSRDLRDQICTYLKNYISEVESIKTSQELSREPNFNLVISTREDNFEICQRVILLLVAFKGKIIAMTHQSFEEILEEVRQFEIEANAIDVYSFEKEEVVSQLKSLRK